MTLQMADEVWNGSKPRIAISARKRSGTKSVAIATSNMYHGVHFLGYNIGAKFQLLCFSSLRDITDFVFLHLDYYQNL